jgi:hypothetical protein
VVVVSPAVAIREHSRKQPFGLLADTPRKLEELAQLQHIGTSAALEDLLVLAHGELVVGERCANPRFIARLKQLANRGELEHARAELRTSYSLEPYIVNVIRELRNGLQLPRRDLVVEYVIQAAWDEKPNDDGGGDKLTRHRRAASHNLHPRLPAAPAALTRTPLPGQLRLLKVEEHTE